MKHHFQTHRAAAVRALYLGFTSHLRRRRQRRATYRPLWPNRRFAGLEPELNLWNRSARWAALAVLALAVTGCCVLPFGGGHGGGRRGHFSGAVESGSGGGYTPAPPVHRAALSVARASRALSGTNRGSAPPASTIVGIPGLQRR